MRIIGYGIELKRITVDDIELIRQWRNSSAIQQYMDYREEITSEMQQKWFTSINNLQNLYCLIFHKQEAAGLIHGADMDLETRVTYNGGIFMKDLYSLTDIPIRATFLMTDISFAFGNQKTFAKVMNHNNRALFYNKSIGYEIVEQLDTHCKMAITEESYRLHSQKLKHLISNQVPEPIKVILETPNDPYEKFVQECYVNFAEKHPHYHISLIKT